MEESKRDRKKEKQKTDETRNNLGKAWVAYKGICAGSLQEFVNHLLAVHEIYCQNSHDRRQEQSAAQPSTEEDEEPNETRPRSPKNARQRLSSEEKSHSSVERYEGRSEPRGIKAEPRSPSSQQHPLPPRSPPPRSDGSGPAARRPRASTRSPSPACEARPSSNTRSEPGELDAHNDDDDDDDDDSSAAGDRQRLPLGICARGLPVRSTESSLKEGLFHKYKKYGKVSSVHIFGQGADRFAVISFKRAEDVTRAMQKMDDLVFFGSELQLSVHEGFTKPEEEEESPEEEFDEYHPKATRTLFVRNLEKDIRAPDLREVFSEFGKILDIDIKGHLQTPYAFIQYTDIVSVVRARRGMHDQYIGSLKIQTGFGKSLPTKCVWLDNISNEVNEKYMCQFVGRFGQVKQCLLNRMKGRALLFFNDLETSDFVLKEMRGRIMCGRRVQVDFASLVCETAFIRDLENTGQLPVGEWSRMRSSSRPSSSFSGRDSYGEASSRGPSHVSSRSHSGDRSDNSFNSHSSLYGRTHQQGSAGSRSSYGEVHRGRSSRQGGSYLERSYSGHDTEFRERRQGYGEHSAESRLHHNNNYEQNMDYSYSKSDSRSGGGGSGGGGGLSPPRKRRSLSRDVQYTRNNHPSSSSSLSSRDMPSGYEPKYYDPYSGVFPESRGEPYEQQQFSPEYGAAHGNKISPPAMSEPASHASFRSLPSESRQGYNSPDFDDKDEPKATFSPMSSDYSQGSPSHS